jgi:Co/Zn/Cd efflux system component
MDDILSLSAFADFLGSLLVAIYNIFIYVNEYYCLFDLLGSGIKLGLNKKLQGTGR